MLMQIGIKTLVKMTHWRMRNYTKFLDKSYGYPVALENSSSPYVETGQEFMRHYLGNGATDARN